MTETYVSDRGNIVQLVQEADSALLELEQARASLDAAKMAVELAKDDLEKAKAHFDQVISRADEVNIPRAKLRKLAEERSAALMASGLMAVPANQASKITKAPGKSSKSAKAKKRTEDSVEDSGDNSSDLDEMVQDDGYDEAGTPQLDA